MLKEIFIIILAPLVVNLITKLVSDWLDSKQGKHKR
ncbi:hypothetical protein JOC28_001764 [Streptococcus loxodontisalivarius]|uniref:Type I toxin-antitoxin system Fst family toxin n=1 Tax=Streptococcus loxodontisalivarius TaxID=1349415 RepID=A0ABS2PTU3_9STRE|nr:hypothetical protein [Streptococcus loxodontisalivarius]